MRIEFSNVRVTRKGNGFVADVGNSRAWFPLHNAARSVDGADEGIAIVEGFDAADEGIAIVEGFDAADDGSIVFARGLERLAFKGEPRRVIRDGVAVTVAGWREVSVPKRDSAREPVALPKIAAMVERAVVKGAKRVSFRFVSDCNERIKIHLAGPNSKNAGSLIITDGGPFGDNRFYGVCSDGEWVPTKATPDTVVEAIRAFDADPAKVGAMSGKREGSCCFCGRDLETRESVSMGYGPICADRYGLPWGEVTDDGTFAGLRDEIAAEDSEALSA